jgi:hypothetical protein
MGSGRAAVCETCVWAQVRNNIMVALTDLTVQYTALVDAHVPRLAACLGDPHELVRRQTLALLASLLSRVNAPHPPCFLRNQARMFSLLATNLLSALTREGYPQIPTGVLHSLNMKVCCAHCRHIRLTVHPADLLALTRLWMFSLQC